MEKEKKREPWGMKLARLAVVTSVAGVILCVLGLCAGSGQVAAFLTDNASSVIQLKNGTKVIGKITGEMRDRLYVKTVLANTEDVIRKSDVSFVRKPLPQELRNIRKTVTIQYVLSERMRQFREEMAEAFKPHPGERAAPIPDSLLKLGQTSTEGKKIFVETGMTAGEVTDIMGEPADKETEMRGESKMEKWHFRGGKTVALKDGIVVD